MEGVFEVLKRRDDFVGCAFYLLEPIELFFSEDRTFFKLGVVFFGIEVRD